MTAPLGGRALLPCLFHPPREHVYFERVDQVSFPGADVISKADWVADSSTLAYTRYGEMRMAAAEPDASFRRAGLAYEKIGRPTADWNESGTQAQAALKPRLRCRIYHHRGFVWPPIREVRGQHFVEESEISPRIRRWFGSVPFIDGLALIILDWSGDFRPTWPAIIGARMLIPGQILLVTEVILVPLTKHKRIHSEVPKSV
jgi:hypothetical protein